MIFLVDYENTKANGLAGLESAHEDDVIVIFFSNACPKKLDMEMFNNFRASLKLVKCCPESKHANYMDFQIVAAASRYIAENQDVCIVSCDKGFQAVQDFWKTNTLFSQHCNVALRSAINENAELPENLQKEEKKKADKKEKKKVKEEKLQKILSRVKCQQDLKSQLIAGFGKSDGEKLFEKYKAQFPEKKTKSPEKQKSSEK